MSVMCCHRRPRHSCWLVDIIAITYHHRVFSWVIIVKVVQKLKPQVGLTARRKMACETSVLRRCEISPVVFGQNLRVMLSTEHQRFGSKVLVMSFGGCFYVSNHFSLRPHNVWFA